MNNVEGPIRIDDVNDLNKSAAHAAATNSELVIANVPGTPATHNAFSLRRANAMPGRVFKVPIVPLELH